MPTTFTAVTDATAGSGPDDIAVEVAYALPERQALIAIRVPAGTTALEAVRLSKIAQRFEGLDVESAPLGVFGRRVEGDEVLRDGDRVEIYRPLTADPKEVRRQLARLGKTMGRGRDQAAPSKPSGN